MTFFPEPIKPSEGRQNDEYRVNPIEPNRQAKEQFDIEAFEKKECKKRIKLYGAFLVYLKNLIKRLDERGKDASPFLSLEGLFGNLEALKLLLLRMKQTDQSENSEFCQTLSETWVSLLQNRQVTAISKRHQEINPEKLTILINQINHYPEEEEHQLGHYLSHYAGNVWLPFPFREILKMLYADHVVNQQNSTLSQWIQTVEELLQS